MQVLHRCRNFSLFNNSFIQSTTTTSSSCYLASFHSTPTSFDKWKNKWSSDVRSGQQPQSKSYIRYATRQKRADAKKALNDLLFNSGSYNGRSSKSTLVEALPKADKTSRWDDHADQSDSSNKKCRSESSAHRASKAHHKRMKCKFRRENFFEEFDEHPGTMFHARFGNRWYTWYFKSWEESSFQSSTTGFDWREHSNWTNSRNKEWDTASETETDDESCVVGSCSDRTILGLPPKGPLKIEDVKNAFRLSALKWHPDKHHGPSQAMAEEKFKHCVNAYKSLCNVLSAI